MFWLLTVSSKSPITCIFFIWFKTFFNLYPTNGPKESPVILSVPIHKKTI